MSWEERQDKTLYKVLVNSEGEYTIHPLERENLLGWTEIGKTGFKKECLDYIKDIWTDMRPLSLRKRMEELELERKKAQGLE